MANERHQYESLAPGETGKSRNEKILGAISIAALTVGGKGLWDRRDGEEQHSRLGNALSTAAISAAGAFTGYKAGELYAKYTGKMGGRVEPYMRSRNGRVFERNGRARSLPPLGTSRREAVGAPEVQHAAKAALLAGATKAFRVRKEPGGWDGPKGRRVLTAAIGAGAIDADAVHKSHKHSKRHALEAIVGGLVGNRETGPGTMLSVNGAESRDPDLENLVTASHIAQTLITVVARHQVAEHATIVTDAARASPITLGVAWQQLVPGEFA